MRMKRLWKRIFPHLLVIWLITGCSAKISSEFSAFLSDNDIEISQIDIMDIQQIDTTKSDCAIKQLVCSNNSLAVLIEVSSDIVNQDDAYTAQIYHGNLTNDVEGYQDSFSFYIDNLKSGLGHNKSRCTIEIYQKENENIIDLFVLYECDERIIDGNTYSLVLGNDGADELLCIAFTVFANQRTSNYEIANNEIAISSVEKDFYLEAAIEDIKEDPVLFKTEAGHYYEIPLDLLAPYGKLRIGAIVFCSMMSQYRIIVII